VSAACDGEEGYLKLSNSTPTSSSWTDAPEVRRLRGVPEAEEGGPDIPIVMLTARSQESEVVLGLELVRTTT